MTHRFQIGDLVKLRNVYRQLCDQICVITKQVKESEGYYVVSLSKIYNFRYGEEFFVLPSEIEKL